MFAVRHLLLAIRRDDVGSDPLRSELRTDEKPVRIAAGLHGLGERRRERGHQDGEDHRPEVEHTKCAALHGRSIEARFGCDAPGQRYLALPLLLRGGASSSHELHTP
jgi:hypothetical protein